MHQGSLSARKKRIARAAKRAAKRARAAKRSAERAAKLPQRDVQAHLAHLDGVLRAAKPPHPDPRTTRCEKKRGPLNRNGGRRGKNKTNAKALLGDVLSAM